MFWLFSPTLYRLVFHKPGWPGCKSRNLYMIHVCTLYIRMYACMDGRTDGWMAQMNGRMDVWMYGCMDVCIHLNCRLFMKRTVGGSNHSVPKQNVNLTYLYVCVVFNVYTYMSCICHYVSILYPCTNFDISLRGA